MSTQLTEAVKREKFNYTEWQRDFFDSIPPEKFEADMAEYFATHDDFSPNAIKVKK